MTSDLEQFIATKEIAIESRHVGLVIDKEWSHDEWRVTLRYQGRTHETSYKTGLGHRVCAPGVRKERNGWSRYHGSDFATTIESAAERNFITLPRSAAVSGRAGTAFGPSLADVVHSLCSDASGADQSFEAWCGDYGADDDSIKALNTYRACQQTRDALLKLFGRELFDELSSTEH